jgi:hypothetical protein
MLSAKSEEDIVTSTGRAYVTRAPIPWKGIMHPISLAEWTRYVSGYPGIELLGYREMVNPFTEAVTRIESPGYALWKEKSADKVAIEHKSGCVITDNRGKSVLAKMRQIAKALDGRLLDDFGNEL